jgi:hypothetical protein
LHFYDQVLTPLILEKLISTVVIFSQFKNTLS